jgi:hypothetical protein
MGPNAKFYFYCFISHNTKPLVTVFVVRKKATTALQERCIPKARGLIEHRSYK